MWEKILEKAAAAQSMEKFRRGLDKPKRSSQLVFSIATPALKKSWDILKNLEIFKR